MYETVSVLARRFFSRIDDHLRLVVVAAVVGVFGGCASVALNVGIRQATELLKPVSGKWYVVFLPVVGAVLGVVFLRDIVRDSAGHGVPEVIYCISRRGGLIRLRASYSRLVSCLLTIASGGSAGPEAPVVVSGASIGSNIARTIGLDDRQRIVSVCCGAAAAIAAIFNAPVTGIIFALEAILEEWAPVSLVPIAIASVVGTEVSRLLQGNQIPFVHRSFHVHGSDLAACLVLAAVTAGVAVLLARSVHLLHLGLAKTFHRDWLRAAAGGFAVGLMGLALPDLLGEGYECVRTVIEGQYTPGIVLIALYLLAKIVATSCTIGSGGSGGIFAPSLMIGSLAGLVFQRILCSAFPDVAWAGEGYYGLLGMAGVMSAVLKAPMTGVFLIVEITGGYDVLVSVVLVSVLSSTLSQFFEPYSFYRRELIERGALLKPRTDSHILSELNVMDLIERDCHVVPSDLSLRGFVHIVEYSHRNYFPVEDPHTGQFLGLVRLDDIRLYLFNTSLYDLVVVADIMNKSVECVAPEESLAKVMRQFNATRSWSLPVVHHGHFMGLVSKATLLDCYRRQLMAEEDEA